MTPQQILKDRFGYSSFRLEQERAIEAVLNLRDTFLLMPTGGGKSLCYQIPALMLPGLTLVISPLIALMKDQVDTLRVNGIEAAYINSTQSFQEQREIVAKAKTGILKLLYVAPERLIKYESGAETHPSPMMDTLLSMQISLIAIDEAHCISQWGHDFRPEYLMLSRLKKLLPGVPVIALTATADRITRSDIVEKLEMQNPAVFVSSFNRPNIRYNVEPKREMFARLVEFLASRRDESGIVYCLSRASTERIASDLCNAGFNALPYHAGLDREHRSAHQEKFLRDDVKIIVATIAFGMGINKSNVRFVVHTDLPKNIEGYYQETGRAGRDGLPSDALLFFSYADVAKLKSFVRVEDNDEQTEIAMQKLDQMAAYGNLNTCRRRFLLNYFDEKADTYCGNCDVCLTTVELYDGTADAVTALAVVAALEGRYGAGYVVDIMRGSKSVKISEEHRNLKVYGSGHAFSREGATQLLHDLVERGYLVKTKGMYPLILLSAAGEAVLAGEGRAMLTRSRTRAAESEGSRMKMDYERPLLARLKELRKNLAAGENVPGYVVLSDASLMEIAAYLPRTKEEFRRVAGFSQMKIEKYGNYFRELVEEYCSENNLQSRIHLKAQVPLRPAKPERDSDTKQQTLDLFMKGYPVGKIAVVRELAPSTIESHLAFYIQAGKLDISRLMERREVEVVRDAINAVGPQGIGAVKQYLGEEYSYGQIRMVLAEVARDKVKMET